MTARAMKLAGCVFHFDQALIYLRSSSSAESGLDLVMVDQEGTPHVWALNREQRNGWLIEIAGAIGRDMRAPAALPAACHRYIKHARSEAEAKALAALGWRCDPDQVVTHHQAHSIRYTWDGIAPPPLPAGGG